MLYGNFIRRIGRSPICHALVLSVFVIGLGLTSTSEAFSQTLADFEVTKTASSTSSAGGNIVYTITVTNNGPGASTPGQNLFNDAIPAFTTFVSFTQSGTAFSCVTPPVGATTSINCFNQTAIASGESTAFMLVVNVNPGTPSGTVISNTALVTHTFDPNLLNNTATATTTLIAPTAASVSISGRVMTQNGRPIRNAAVTLDRQFGEPRTVLTSSFGYYTFTDLSAGQVYAVSVSAKGYVFAEPVRTVSVYDDILEFNFFAEN